MEDRRIARTKKALRDAFIRLLRHKSFSEITVSELTREADIDRRTFYTHYDNIAEIVDEIDAEAIQILEDAIQDIPVNSREFFEALTHIMVNNYEYYEVIIQNRGFYSLEYRCKSILRKALIKYYTGRTELDPVKLEFYAEYEASGIMSVYTHWLRHGKPLELPELTDLTYNVAVGDPLLLQQFKEAQP